MSTTIINTARPFLFAAVTAASGIGLAPFAIDAVAPALQANDRSDGLRAANVIRLVAHPPTGRRRAAARFAERLALG